jgi:hypothetical protein
MLPWLRALPQRSLFCRVVPASVIPRAFTHACMPFSDRRDLENFGLEPFEVAQLGNLCPGDAQEAKALIPSLAMPDRDIDNTRLTELLEQLNSFKQYG